MPPADNGQARYASAAQFLNQAVQAGCHDPNVLYMLALAHKRQGKVNDARAALRKVNSPDAEVVLQMALLSLREGNMAQAEEELSRAWALDPTSYEICNNLLLTRLTLGKLDECAELIPKAFELVSQRNASAAAEEGRFLTLLQALLRSCKKGGRPDPLLAELTPADEQRLLKLVRSLGQLDTVHLLLGTLSQARPRSAAVREAYLEAVLVKGKELMDRCNWTEAELLLRPLAREKAGSRTNQVALLNLLGCCACMTQDFDSALRHFSAAIKLIPNDPRLHQNVALTHELKGELSQADPHWNRYFDMLGDQVPVPPDIPHYLEMLAYESLSRLAGRYSEKEKWSTALGYVQRAQQLRPNDTDTLERLFHLYNQAKRPQDARRTLDQLRRLRPNDPQYDLFELDLIEVKNLNDIEHLLSEVDRVRKRFPGDARVEDRAVGWVGNVIPLMHNLCDQLTDQMGKIIDQVRNLPNYQINWGAVREVMRDLLKEFQRLRRITGKCLPLVSNDEQRRFIRELAEHIDKKMEACRSMGA
jgi:Flp pilus assembly protein TadD